MDDGTYRVANGAIIGRLALEKGYTVGVENLAKRFGSTDERTFTHYVADGLAGLWTDGPLQYIDRVEIIQDLDTALSIARERGELAIWDNANNREIRLASVEVFE